MKGCEVNVPNEYAFKESIQSYFLRINIQCMVIPAALFFSGPNVGLSHIPTTLHNMVNQRKLINSQILYIEL